MADLRDFTGKNRKFTGTLGERISTGSTAERDTSFGAGTIRYNTTSNLMEYYSGTEWKSIDAPPILNTVNVDGAGDVSSVTIDNELSGNATIVIKGSLFDTTGAEVTFIGTGETLSPSTTVRDSSTQITVTIPYSSFDVVNNPYTVRVTNGSSLFAELGSAISADVTTITFLQNADTTYGLFDSIRATGSGSIAAADLCGATSSLGSLTYSVSSGALPSGFTLNTSTGAITWSAVSAVVTDVTTTFSITATGDEATATRQFKITVKAPVVESYTSTGSFSYTVPSGLSTVKVLVVAGGGYGGGGTGGGGGAGGMVDVSSYPVTSGAVIPGTVGAGSPGGNEITPGQGSPSTFGTLTAIGGGSAGWDNGGPARTPQPGGSGGGGSGYNPNASGTTTGVQPSQPGDSGTYGYGNPGLSHPSEGAGGAGAGASPSSNGAGGAGRSSTITGSSVTYAGGGGGGGPSSSPAVPTHAGGAGGGGIGSPDYPGGARHGGPGVANTGGGGGGAWDHALPGGGGGSGVVIISY
jgi:hypothetical protein